MHALTARAGALRASEVALAALLAAVLSLLLVQIGPPPGDAAAHLYRTFLVEHGVAVWDNLWYGGQYPLASYSLLYYLPAALVGNVPLVVAAVVVSAALFASIAKHEWGAAGRWPALSFGVAAVGPLVTGTFAYALGVAALLACLRALQARRGWLAIAAAALTLGFSPLAFVFLCLVLGAALLARRRVSGRALAVGAAVVALGGVQLAVAALFPLEGSYPFRVVELAAVLGVAALGAALARNAPRGAVLAAFFLLWAGASATAFAIDSPMGENVARVRSVVFPLVLVAAVLARFRPRWLATAALTMALAYNLGPYVAVAPSAADTRAARQEFWAPSVAFLRTHSSPNYRVDVVPTLDNWEAYWLPRAGIPLARGWYRQLDMGRNEVLYKDSLSAADYRAWLRRMAVRYVLLPSVPLDHVAAKQQAKLLRSGRSGLVAVFRGAEGTVYELPRAVPLLSGPGPARLTRLTHDRVSGWVGAPGSYRLRIRYTRYWQVASGAVCVEALPDRMTEVEVHRAGRFVLRVPEQPGALVRSVLGDGSGC
jgi:hypothetical protein